MYRRIPAKQGHTGSGFLEYVSRFDVMSAPTEAILFFLLFLFIQYILSAFPYAIALVGFAHVTSYKLCSPLHYNYKLYEYYRGKCLFTMKYVIYHMKLIHVMVECFGH